MAYSDVPQRLFHILEAIQTLETAFEDADEISVIQNIQQRWILERGFEIISEASRHIPEALKERFDIDWRGVRDIGNVLRHGYRRASPEQLWGYFVHDLPPLKAAVEQLYAETKESSDPWPGAAPAGT